MAVTKETMLDSIAEELQDEWVEDVVENTADSLRVLTADGQAFVVRVTKES